MTAFRLLLLLLLTALTLYTAHVIATDGLNLFPYFFGDMAKLGWPGQFNSDFAIMLILSGLWTAWRNGFSLAGIGLAVLAAGFGSVFLTIYLLYLSWHERGDVPRMLVGNRLGSAH